MKILIVAATELELRPLLEKLEKEAISTKESGVFQYGEHEIRIVITGVGMVLTTLVLTQLFMQYRPDFAINLGVAGAFDRNLKLGDVVHVESEILADFGAEDADGHFMDAFEMGLLDANQPPFINGRLYNSQLAGFEFLPAVRAITVNKVHGSAASIAAIEQKYQPQIESMEGAAFFLCCLQADLSFVQIRAISNYVEPRNKANWKMDLAVEKLCEVGWEVIGAFRN